MATRAPSQVRLIFYCLPTTDRVIRIYKFTSCFRSTLLLLNPKAFNTHITLKFLTHVWGRYISIVEGVMSCIRGRHVGGVISWGRHDLLPLKRNPRCNCSMPSLSRLNLMIMAKEPSKRLSVLKTLIFTLKCFPKLMLFVFLFLVVRRR